MQDFNSVMIQAWPMIKTSIGMLIFLGFIIGGGFFLFKVLLPRKWAVTIWEKKSDGKLHMVSKDVLIQKKVDGGKHLLYWLRRQKVQAFPPPVEATHRVRGKEYVDYLRVEDEYMPLVQKLKSFNGLDSNDKKSLISKYKAKLNFIKRIDKKQVYDRFIHVPINRSLSANFEFDGMDYDVKMLMINAIDVRDKVYQGKLDFWQKYGHFMAIGFIVVLIIVVLYFSYDYSGQVIQSAFGNMKEVINPLERIANSVGGAAPPS